MLFDPLDQVKVIETGKLGIIKSSVEIKTNEYFFGSGQILTKVEYRYLLIDDDKQYHANEIQTHRKYLIDRE